MTAGLTYLNKLFYLIKLLYFSFLRLFIKRLIIIHKTYPSECNGFTLVLEKYWRNFMSTKTDDKTYQIMGISWPVFLVLTVVITTAMYMGKLPGGLIILGAMMVYGALLDEIGNRTPIIKDYLGGGAIVCIFGAALLAYYGVFPEGPVKSITTFMKGGQFLNFYIAALICGSILGMSRDFLIKAFVRYLPIILGGVIVALGLTGIVGALIGFGFRGQFFMLLSL